MNRQDISLNDISSNDIFSNDTPLGDIYSKDVPKGWFENDNKISLFTVCFCQTKNQLTICQMIFLQNDTPPGDISSNYVAKRAA